MNVPLLPDGFGPVEAYGWPLSVLVVSAAMVGTVVSDFTGGTTLLPLASLLIGTVTGALALRLTLWPLAPGFHPLALVGVRETLSVFTAIYLMFAFVSQKGRS